jgi:tyrosyl-tRNA synthetase
MAVTDLLTATKLASSKSEAVRLLKGGGVYVNNARVGDEKARLSAGDAIGGQLFILRKGRKDQHIVRLVR